MDCFIFFLGVSFQSTDSVWGFRIDPSTELVFQGPPISFTEIPITFKVASIPTDFQGNPNVTFRVNPAIYGTNVPIPSESIDDPTLLAFFTGHKTGGYGRILVHHTCKCQPESCMDLKFTSPIKDMCLMIGGMDGYDHVSIELSANGVPVVSNTSLWTSIANGPFSEQHSDCPPTIAKSRGNALNITSFEDLCTSNPNYNIFMTNQMFDNIKLCYSSHLSQSVFYSLTPCSRQQIIASTPPPELFYAVAGMAYFDANANGRYDYGTDRPLSNINVTLINFFTQQPATSTTTSKPIEDFVTDSSGVFVLYPVRAGFFEVKFKYDPKIYSAVMPQDIIQGNSKTSKIDQHFKSIRVRITQRDPGVRKVDEDDHVSKYVGYILPTVYGGVVNYNGESNSSQDTFSSNSNSDNSNDSNSNSNNNSNSSTK
ncbi:hypothetical protein DFA_05054 [Cavenderia fasciculata]|uniref:SD-repeat containing protein B domain-containing protein n=1 Tax=Cavenderia fasciculata TaxID=261658 RepID=F4PN71_CACFS|nr:uncharacterized protein DFA_05054 [Cavenderia fasciculata]EGG22924.1 hypothetical protein DFA_05054 [Cavenderia fasciculata]|eukprot:XP_004360775.1 hypothetical protein DFA_05054 [Cavenderia fasciculata]